MKVILGGTFDPVHNGHLRMAVELRESLNTESVALLPCYQPVHRDRPGASAQQRLDMLKLATSHEPGLSVDAREIRREGPSFMVDTLQELRAELGSAPLVLAMGVDAFAGLSGWHRWQHLLALSHIVVMHRPGWALPAEGPVAECLSRHRCNAVEDLSQASCGSIYLLPLRPMDVSSTEIRSLVQRGKSARFLVPCEVWNYIQKNRLYC
ncbi:MAG: nicotinate-nucleotide adenylyltransferase [Hahellaceae bacterium]|nr:nicotinate-nucleotide adenylyltransferase [Hahellaceae bacterium]MCP5169893.1 nicotinate-nucleotide adenylyltransferase [Hahellaceae bacterium]